MSLLSCVEIEPAAPAVATVIWLHGLGASGHDFEPIVPELRLHASLPVRFLFPHAPQQPVTINGGMVMPSWYDIYSMDLDRKIDQQQLRVAADGVHALIEREIARGIQSERIVIAGFSQGGAVAYEAALSYDKPLAGLMALSTYFATHDTVALSPANAALPIKIDHGLSDPVVPELLGQQAVAHLTAKGFKPTYHTYAMQHEVCWPQIADISQWLQRCVASS